MKLKPILPKHKINESMPSYVIVKFKQQQHRVGVKFKQQQHRVGVNPLISLTLFYSFQKVVDICY